MANFSLTAIQFRRVARPRRTLRDLTFAISGQSTFVTMRSIIVAPRLSHILPFPFATNPGGYVESQQCCV